MGSERSGPRRLARGCLAAAILGGAVVFLFTRGRGMYHLAQLRELEASEVRVVRVGAGSTLRSGLAPITNPNEIERLLHGLRAAERVSYDSRPSEPLLRLELECVDGRLFRQAMFTRRGDEQAVYVEGGLHDYLLRGLELGEFVRRALDSTRKDYGPELAPRNS